MQKIKTVFLDMDGVITDFNKVVCEQFDFPHPPQKYDYFDPIRSEVNSICTFEFWRSLPWTDDGRDILGAIKDTLGLDKIYFLTAMMPNIETASGKMMWLRDNLPVYIKRTILLPLGVPKSFLARPDTLLIDDSDKSVEGFEAAGGQGLLVPRPYNQLRTLSDRASQHVKHCLEARI